jgi:hypothetical protein
VNTKIAIWTKLREFYRGKVKGSTKDRRTMDQESSFRSWTPEVYETLHSTLSNLLEGLDAHLNQLAELLEICFPIFNNVLQNPVPAEADRTKLLARMSYDYHQPNNSNIESR